MTISVQAGHHLGVLLLVPLVRLAHNEYPKLQFFAATGEPSCTFSKAVGQRSPTPENWRLLVSQGRYCSGLLGWSGRENASFSTDAISRQGGVKDLP